MPSASRQTPRQYNPAIVDNKKVALIMKIKPLTIKMSSMYLIKNTLVAFKRSISLAFAALLCVIK